jgi:hypothetical protein
MSTRPSDLPLQSMPQLSEVRCIGRVRVLNEVVVGRENANLVTRRCDVIQYGERIKSNVTVEKKSLKHKGAKIRSIIMCPH